jgi:hypothetical protein
VRSCASHSMVSVSILCVVLICPSIREFYDERNAVTPSQGSGETVLLHSDFWFPYRDEISVEVKMYGRRAFTVDHQQYVINADSSLKGSSGDTGENVLVAPSAALRP